MLKSNQIYNADCLELMKELEDNSIDSIVTDPPYGLEFMNKEWDSINKHFSPVANNKYPKNRKTRGVRYDESEGSAMQNWHYQWAKECLRILKPGGHLLAFGGTRTYHRLACAIEDAGFEIRDQIQWIYGSGFPKSLNIGKQVDELLGNEREDLGYNENSRTNKPNKDVYEAGIRGKETRLTQGNSEWEGWGTGLKPANEPICMARKPISEKNIAENVLKWGTGGLNIDECRIEFEKGGNLASNPSLRKNIKGGHGGNIIMHEEESRYMEPHSKGRFPSNVILDEEAAEMLDEQSNASRFYYVAKASKAERNEGCEGLKKEIGHNRFDQCDVCGGYILQNPDRPSACKCENPKRGNNIIKGNYHPTVKPIKLMRYLVRLVTPPRGIVLDPFLGSGTTVIACIKEKFNYIGIEKESDYFEIARIRIVFHGGQLKLDF